MPMLKKYLSPIEDVIEDARNGKMFILADDEDRENEGDLIIPAQMATPDAINFMAKHGRGLICLALTNQRVTELGLPLMAAHNKSRHETAFTVSIEAATGVTTGISAADRARTVAVAIDPTKGKYDIHSPGHVFPLRAQDGGVLVRAGHTEAAVDISRLAGLIPAGVICEIMNDDGTMARLPDLVKFAQEHNLKVATIRDLIAYRRRTERLVRRLVEKDVCTRYGGDFHVILYSSNVDDKENIAWVKGDISGPEPVLVRMHAINAAVDMLGVPSPRAGQLEAAMRMIGEAGRGVIVLLREENVLSQYFERLTQEATGGGPAIRDYGIGAQILLDLGIRDMILLTNSNPTIMGLDGYELNIVEQRPIPTLPADGN